jgi:glycosyltransferase involved in cell wall biosynthesis
MISEPLRAVALLYDDDAYVETLRAARRLRGDGRAVGLMGRQVAGKEFLKACLDHGSWTELAALVRDPRSAESLKALWRAKAWRPHARRLRIVDERQFHHNFLKNPPAPILHLPCPPDSRYVWARQACAPHAFGLTGVTHTLCSLEAVRQICDYVTAPFEPFDALVCTSTAVLAMVHQVTESYAEHLHHRHGGHPTVGLRLVHIPLGVDTDRYRPPTEEERARERQALGIDADDVAVLFVGRLSHHAKAHPFPMFEGLARAAREAGQKVHLILAGWAANPTVHQAFVDGARLFAPGLQVRFVDGESPEQRFAVWRAADLFTSLPDNIQETFGLVIAEAMACGLPVVASDWNGYRDLVVQGETGLLVPTAMLAGANRHTTSRLVLGEINYDHFVAECSQTTVVDPIAAARAYRELLTDPLRRRAMGEAGRRRALERFTWQRVIRQYEALWSEQAALRLEYQRHAEPGVASGGPALYPEPQRTFHVYPTTLIDAVDRVAADPSGLERLDTFLATPLTHHVGDRRVCDRSILAQILATAASGCSIAELDSVFERAGVEDEMGRATLAWLLKYGLLRAEELTTASPGSVTGCRVPGFRRDSPGCERAQEGGSKLCFVTTCMGQLSYLAGTLGSLVAQPYCSCVVVDYSCPDRCGDWVLEHHPAVRVVRVGNRIDFDRAVARNLGAAAASAPWLCFVDANIRIAPNFAETVLPRLGPGCWFGPDSTLEGTAGVFICARDDFLRAGRYDEVPVCWTEADDDLRDGLELAGVRRATFPAALLQNIAASEVHSERSDLVEPPLQHAINRVYRISKRDTARLRGNALVLSMRQQLYRTVTDIVTAAWSEGKPGDLSVRLPFGIVPGGWSLPRSLSYRLVKEAPLTESPAEPSPSQTAVLETGEPP